MSLLITSSKLSPVLHSLDRTNNVCRSLDLVADVWLWVVAKLHLWHLTLCVLGFQRIMLELCLYNSLFIKQFVYITVCLHNSFDQMCKDFDASNCFFFFFIFIIASPAALDMHLFFRVAVFFWNALSSL